MATGRDTYTYALERANGQPFGSFAEVQGMIRQPFPNVVFCWDESGAEMLSRFSPRGIEPPTALRTFWERLPSLLNGIDRERGYLVAFCLGHQEPVTSLKVTTCIKPPRIPRFPPRLPRKLNAGLVSLASAA